MITKYQYIEYPLSTPPDYTCTNLPAHLEGVSRDAANDFPRDSRFTPQIRTDLILGRHIS
ncbi:MAG: hypothetical protein M3525_11065 [Acidobacteriota bacterium]|nr:hypothetical protein [Acidobacteriota bacterium]